MFLLLCLLVTGITAKPYLVWPGQYGVQMGPWLAPRFSVQPIVIDIEIDHECVAEGVFVNPEDCGSYFICNDNGHGLTPSKVYCPGEPGILAFNEETGSCDWATNVEGCSSCLFRSLMTPAPAVSPVVVDPFVDFSCKEEGTFMNPEDCGSYISCKNICREGIKAFKIGCPATLLFNTDLGVCDFAHNVPDCAQRTVATNPQPTPQPIVAAPCDVAEGIFPLGWEGPCVSGVIAENPHTFEEVKDPKEFDCSGKTVGSYPHPTLTICDEFYVCTGDKRTFHHVCAQGTLYDPTTGHCSIFEVAGVQCDRGRDERWAGL